MQNFLTGDDTGEVESGSEVRKYRSPATPSLSHESFGASLSGIAAVSILALSGCSGNKAQLPAGTRDVTSLNSYEEIERNLTIGTDMKIVANGVAYGTVEQKVMAMSTIFEHKDSNGNLVARARKRNFSLGTKIDISDRNGEVIGCVCEKVFESLVSIKSQYEILDAQGNVIASSEKLDFFGTDIKINSPSGTLLAHITRPAINVLSDSWTVEAPGDIDKRLIVFIPAFKTYADNQKD